MGVEVQPDTSPTAIRRFTQALLRDLQALELLLERGMIERGVRRFGAEQEMFLVDREWRPAPVAIEVLDTLGERPFTTELALFNLEANLEPMQLRGSCFTALESRLSELVEEARAAARLAGAEVALCGILPTLVKADLALDNMTPRPRYHALNEALTRMRGGPYHGRIVGTDELLVEHDSVMLEACNTSCQVHLQVTAEEFAHVYNVAQVVTPAVLAIAANSPLLFGRRLWAETRIALLQQSIDTRSASIDLRELAPRVHYGDGWVRSSVVELFQEDLSRFRVLMGTPVQEDPFEVLERGGVPRLQALQLYNSTVYRWNRPCYGISDGKPHLRIECRALPAGPSVVDEVANAAFWIGLVVGGAREMGDVRTQLDFEDVKGNFLAASSLGLKSGFQWLGGKTVSVPALILDTLLPMARRGLESCGVDAPDVTRYLDVVAARAESAMTGSQWALGSLASMRGVGTRSQRLAALVAATVRMQEQGRPCHEWELARLSDIGSWEGNYRTVSQYMRTDLVTVHEDELVDLVAFLMDRKQIRQILVEDAENRLLGLVSYRSILRLVSRGAAAEGPSPPVSSIMESDLLTVAPDTSTLEAIELMRTKGVSCLPVVKDEKLVGLVSEHDFIPIAYELLKKRFSGEGS